eukprot:4145628-Ditylum_brightwellii.AAC.1
MGNWSPKPSKKCLQEAVDVNNGVLITEEPQHLICDNNTIDNQEGFVQGNLCGACSVESGDIFICKIV